MLPPRNLLRQLAWSLPSGRSIAAAMGVRPLSAADLADIGSVYEPFANTDLTLGPTPDTSITGNRTYTRANFLYDSGAIQPGTYR